LCVLSTWNTSGEEVPKFVEHCGGLLDVRWEKAAVCQVMGKPMGGAFV
jgi:hypothetical protein